MENASDQEQLEAIRKWWNENGKAVVGGLLLGLGGVLGWQYWQDRERGLAEEASVLYFQTSESLAADNVAQGQSRGQALKQDYPGSPYAALAALALAARDVEAEQYDAAAVQLRWVVDNATQPELVDVARLRLARVMMAKGEGDEGLTLLAVVSPPYRAAADEIRGDIFLLQGEPARAREAYESAQAALALSGADDRFLQIKLNDLAVPAPTDQVGDQG